MESYIDINKIIKLLEEQKDFTLAEKIQNLQGKEKRIFLSIYEFKDNELLDTYSDGAVFLMNLQEYLIDEFTGEEIKEILISLGNKKIIFFNQLFNSNQIFPPYAVLSSYDDEDDEDIDWADYTPKNLTSDLTENQKRIKLERTRRIYFEYHGYYEEDKEQFFKNIIDRIREEMGLNKDVKICEAFGFTKMRDSLFTGVSFTLANTYLTTNSNAGTLTWVNEYKDGKQHGRGINYYPNGNIQTEFIYNEGEEISKRKYDEDSNEEKRNENICYVDREELDVKNLTIFASMKPEFLDWVVMDMPTRKVVFTSDSNSECEKWISKGNIQYNQTESTDNETTITDGIHTKYYDNGELEYRVEFKLGKMNGQSKYYYESGARKNMFEYKLGKMNGQSKYYYESGELQSEGIFQDNHREGVWKGYYKNGKLRKMSEFKNGEELSLEEWDEEGNKKD